MSFKGLSFVLQVTRDSDGHSMTVPLPPALVGLVAEAIDRVLPGDHPDLFPVQTGETRDDKGKWHSRECITGKHKICLHGPGMISSSGIYCKCPCHQEYCKGLPPDSRGHKGAEGVPGSV